MIYREYFECLRGLFDAYNYFRLTCHMIVFGNVNKLYISAGITGKLLLTFGKERCGLGYLSSIIVVFSLIEFI